MLDVLNERVPHSPQNTMKIASSLLERDFFYCVLHRPAAGGVAFWTGWTFWVMTPL